MPLDIRLNFLHTIVMTQAPDKAHYRNHPRVDFSRANASDPSSIIYKLFTRANPHNHTILTEENIEEQNLNKNVKTVLVIHGWTSSDSSPWFGPIKEAYLHHADHNIIYVNWSAYGNMSYGVSSANVRPVGEFIARFLRKSKVPSKKIHLVGHSLGSQLSSFIAKAYEKEFGEKLGRITGLDPAGPLWANADMAKEERLCELDADFVDVVHTDIQIYGYTHPCGHVDFYPNGGTDQPGCPDEEQKENCNHHRATRLFIESVGTKVTASEIDFEEDKDHNIIITHKENSNNVIFGEHADFTARGAYFFKTRHATPYLENAM